MPENAEQFYPDYIRAVDAVDKSVDVGGVSDSFREKNTHKGQTTQNMQEM